MGESQFTSPAAHYDRFMGRYTRVLAPALVDAAQIRPPARALDVGCGPGGLTAELARRLGGEHVAGIDPAEQFVAAARERVPAAELRVGLAEDLPWDDDTFDATLSSLVLGFMDDPDRGVSEMLRVTRPGGTVAIAMWDLPDGMTMIRQFWQAFRTVRPDLAGDGEGRRAGSWAGDIADRLTRAGAASVYSGVLEVTTDYADFTDWWEPMTFRVGPVGQALATLSEADQVAVREECRRMIAADGPFSVTARAWFARGDAR